MEGEKIDRFLVSINIPVEIFSARQLIPRFNRPDEASGVVVQPKLAGVTWISINPTISSMRDMV